MSLNIGKFFSTAIVFFCRCVASRGIHSGNFPHLWGWFREQNMSKRMKLSFQVSVNWFPSPRRIMKFVCQRPSDTELTLEKEWSSKLELFRSSKYRAFMLQINWRIDGHTLWYTLYMLPREERNFTTWPKCKHFAVSPHRLTCLWNETERSKCREDYIRLTNRRKNRENAEWK